MNREELKKEAEENSFRYTLDKPWACEVERKQIMAHFEKGYLAGAKPREKRIAELEAQIEKMKRHCNCKHRDSEGYCEVKRTYLMDLSYDGCDKWELEKSLLKNVLGGKEQKKIGR